MSNNVAFFAINADNVARARKFYELVPGHMMLGFECTITVADFDRTIRAIEANGGRLAAPKFHIPTVGTCACFFDTEGNVAGLRQPEGDA